MQQPLVELGGRGPVLLIVPANGFPLETYLPMLEPLMDEFRVVGLPPRALWAGIGDPPSEAGSWESLADDLLIGLEESDLPPVIAVGHSFGAVVSILAAARDPARFQGLALLDSTIFPRAVMGQIEREKEDGLEARFSLIELARNRRDRFDSLEEGFTYWRSKPLFQDWSDEALRSYTRAALTTTDDGEGLTLTWPAQWEAWYYRSFYPGTWEHVERLPRELSLLSIRGALSDTFLIEAEAQLGALRPAATIRCLEGAGHLFPHSVPAKALALLQPWLRGLRVQDFLDTPGTPRHLRGGGHDRP